MSITYENKPIEWDNVGIEPPQDLIETGFVAGYKPPAEYFNAILNRTTAAITEIQEKTADLSVTEEAHTINAEMHITDAECVYAEESGYTLTLANDVGTADYYCVRFKAPNAYVEGATFTIDTTAYTAVNASFSENDVVILNFDPAQQKCFFVSGGGKMTDENNNLISENSVVENTQNTVVWGDNLSRNTANSVVTGYCNNIDKASNVNVSGMYNSITVTSGNENSTVSSSLISGWHNNVILQGEGNDSDEASIVRGVIIAGDYNDISSGTVINTMVIGAENKVTSSSWEEGAAYSDRNNASMHGSMIVGFQNDITNMTHGIVVGRLCTVSETAKACAIFGEYNTAKSLNFVIGKYNKSTTAASASGTTGDLFVIGNGLSSARTNAFRVTAAGDVMGTKSYAATGADYAEMFEWADGNKKNADRRGLFVTLDGEKIRLATADDDYILGVVSATPSVVADAHSDDWCKKWKTDIFGERLLDDNGAWILNDEFVEEDNEKYVSRADRKEWAAIGMVGKLIVIDDGTCEVNGYCTPTKGGKATKSETGYRVIARLDDTHIKVVVK